MSYTIQQVIDTIISSVPGAPFEDSVDVFKSGDPAQPVTGIVTTFIATRRVIDRAAEVGANLIITHEPTYFEHRDAADWLPGDPVVESKRRLIERHSIAIWRFHDYWHMHRPDGIETGFVRLLGWEAHQDAAHSNLVTLPDTTLADLVSFLKSRLDMPTMRVVGQPDMPCRRVAIVLGALPGHVQIGILRDSAADVLICGETTEWQTCEYVRDAVAAGMHKALVILGHEKSEEPGMAYLADWLRDKAPGVPITHVPAGDPLSFW